MAFLNEEANYASQQNTGAMAQNNNGGVQNHIRYELNLENGVPKGTQVQALHLNPNWGPCQSGWIARADIVTDEKLYLNNISVKNKKDGGYWTQYPSSVRMRDGQPVKDEKGYDIRDEFYHPYVNTQAGFSGRKVLDENLTFPLVQQCLSSADGRAFENPQDPWHASRMFKSNYQSSVAFGELVVNGVPIVVRNIWIRPVYDEQGQCSLRLGWPSEKKLSNGQEVIGNDGKPVYNNYVIPAKESAQPILEAIGMKLQEELNKRQ